MTNTTTPTDDPFAITSCEECGAADRDYGQHEPGCPSGFPTRDLTAEERDIEEMQNAVRDFEDNERR